MNKLRYCDQIKKYALRKFCSRVIFIEIEQRHKSNLYPCWKRFIINETKMLRAHDYQMIISFYLLDEKTHTKIEDNRIENRKHTKCSIRDMWLLQHTIVSNQQMLLRRRMNHSF